MLLRERVKKFCAAVVAGSSGKEAYLTAYPGTSAPSARRGAARLLGHPEVQLELVRLRSAGAGAEIIMVPVEPPGGEAATAASAAPAVVVVEPQSPVLSVEEKRAFLARLVRARAAELPLDSDLWQSIRQTPEGPELKLPSKLAALKLDNDLAGEGAEAEANDSLAALLRRVMQ